MTTPITGRPTAGRPWCATAISPNARSRPASAMSRCACQKSGIAQARASAFIRACCRLTGAVPRSIEELLPWLYLKGLSTGDFQEALKMPPGWRRRCSAGSSRNGARDRTIGSSGILVPAATCAGGPMACIPTFEATIRAPVCSSSSASCPTVRKSSWPSMTVCGNPRAP